MVYTNLTLLRVENPARGLPCYQNQFKGGSIPKIFPISWWKTIFLNKSTSLLA
jgi:hypothetical protein